MSQEKLSCYRFGGDGKVPVMAIPAENASSTKGDRTRSLLLEIAVRRFALDGYRRTSVSDIAREARLSPAAVYAYFAGKEALFQAAVDLDAGALIDRARTAIAGTPVRARESVILAELADHIAEHPLAARVLSGQEPEVIDRVLDLPSLREFNAQIANDIAEAQLAGEVRTDVDPTTMANGFEAIILTLLMGFLQARVARDSRLAVGALTVLDAALRPPS
jgi:AcrR family transcriptional regulator